MAILIPFILFVTPMGIVFAVLYGHRLRIKLKKKRTPLTTNLMRSSGESLRARIDDLTQDAMFYMSLMPAILLFFYAMHLSESYLLGKPETSFRIMASVVPSLAFLGYLLFKLLRSLDLRRRLRLAHDAELAVGQELNHLMSHGYQVYHDLPAPNFNIDHILVGSRRNICCRNQGQNETNDRQRKRRCGSHL